ncbi:MAG: hypothetical protein L0Y58_03205 [Verrucomicrobia subdivision 3 bacterium]|nr:hypothetical protein [Limisphaerales bacterium]
MPCSTLVQRCNTSPGDRTQSFPVSGGLLENLDCSRDVLLRLVRPAVGEQAFSYIVSTVKVDRRNRYRQTGSAPNFQGDCLTLCTCKHQMRSRIGADDWPGKWIIGLSSRKNDNRHWLIYLARVRSAYESHSELWIALPQRVRQAKSSRHFRLGDLHEPRRVLNGPARFDPNNYHDPIAGHVHADKWDIDVDYALKERKRQPTQKPLAPLLVADSRLTFLWQEPILHFSQDHIRDYLKWQTLTAFLENVR